MGCGFDEGMLPSDEAEREVVERVGETALPQAFPSGPQGVTVYEYTPTVGDMIFPRDCGHPC